MNIFKISAQQAWGIMIAYLGVAIIIVACFFGFHSVSITISSESNHASQVLGSYTHYVTQPWSTHNLFIEAMFCDIAYLLVVWLGLGVVFASLNVTATPSSSGYPLPFHGKKRQLYLDWMKAFGDHVEMEYVAEVVANIALGSIIAGMYWSLLILCFIGSGPLWDVSRVYFLFVTPVLVWLFAMLRSKRLKPVVHLPLIVV